MVAFAEPSGVEMGPGAVMPKDVEVVNGRKRREMKLGIVAAMRIVRIANVRTRVNEYSLKM